MKTRLWSVMLVLPLVACGPEGDGGTEADLGRTKTGLGLDFSDGLGIGGTTGDLLHPWNRYFVTQFDMAKVARIRDLAGFVANNLDAVLTIADHPVYGGSGKLVDSNALEAARLDYALSTGLTGEGQIISIIDDRIRISHEQFAGKTLYVSGSPPVGSDFHGTAVASVAAGTGSGGGALGFAPGADVHLGYLDYSAAVDWRQLGTYMRHAAEVGAVVSNNSWGLSSATLDTVDVDTYFANAQQAPYIAGLREFAQDGVVVFALQNDYWATSASLVAGIPLGFPDLEANWITVINAIPEYDDERILSAERISAACLETARFCMSANGQVRVATATGDEGYSIGVGASFAAPQVAGSMALLAQAFPDLSPAQLRDRLLATADNSFFAATGEVEFAPGISHGFNEEFGHGFLDLRSALLPIGEVVVPMQDGGTLIAGTPAISGGPASGDALARSLSATRVVSLDGLHGSFETSAEFLGEVGSGFDLAASAAALSMKPDAAGRLSERVQGVSSGSAQLEAATLLADPSGSELMGGYEIPLLSSDSGLRVAAFSDLALGEAWGIGVKQDLILGGTLLRAGVSAMQVEGSVLGVTVPEMEEMIRSDMASFQIALASKIGAGTAIRLDAEFGRAEGNGAGMVSDFGTLSYDRIGMTIDRAHVLQRGDLFSVFLRQPVGITRGAARMELPSSYALGDIGFVTHDVDLAPSSRQMDLGFEYGVPLGESTTLSLGLLHSRNHGNVEGRSGFSGFLGVHIGI